MEGEVGPRSRPSRPSAAIPQRTYVQLICWNVSLMGIRVGFAAGGGRRGRLERSCGGSPAAEIRDDGKDGRFCLWRSHAPFIAEFADQGPGKCAPFFQGCRPFRRCLFQGRRNGRHPQNSGTSGRAALIGEFGYEGGVIAKGKTGILIVAFSGGASPQDVQVSRAGLAVLQTQLIPMSDTFQQINWTFVRWNNRTFSYFGGCDYFRLASHRRVTSAVRRGMRQYGLNVAASRSDDRQQRHLRTIGDGAGGFLRHRRPRPLFPAVTPPPPSPPRPCKTAFRGCSLMKKPTAVCARPAANLAARSRLSNTATPPTWHASWPRGGAGQSDSIDRWPLLPQRRSRPARALFAVPAPPRHDPGGRRPRRGHSGENGRGSPEYFGVPRDRIIQTISLSKAFGCFGGAILGAPSCAKKSCAPAPCSPAALPFPRRWPPPSSRRWT